jgi:hypothetical protein
MAFSTDTQRRMIDPRHILERQQPGDADDLDRTLIGRPPDLERRDFDPAAGAGQLEVVLSTSLFDVGLHV